MSAVKKNMNIRGFLFDVDGVLYDSMPLHARSWREAFKEKGVKILDKPVYECEGMPDTKAVHYIYKKTETKIKISNNDLEFVRLRKIALFDTYKKPRLIKGSKKLIAFLQKQGIGVCLVTGSHQEKTIERLQKDFGIPRDKILTGQEVANGKPHPEPYLRGLKRLGLSAKEALVVENAPLGITSAKRAKIQCVALKTGLLSEKDLKKCKPNWIRKDCAELLRTIQIGLFQL